MKALALGLLIAAGLVVSCGEEDPKPPRGPIEKKLRRPALGGIVFRGTRDDTNRISENPMTGELQLLGAPLAAHVGFARDVYASDVVIEIPLAEKQRFHAIVRPRDKTLATARHMLAERIAEALDVRLEERTAREDVLILKPARGTLALTPSAAGQASFSSKPGELRMIRQPISRLIRELRDGTDMPIVDRTRLNAEYDFLLQWDPAAGAYALIQALRDVGLELVPGRRRFTRVVVVQMNAGPEQAARTVEAN